MKRSFCHFLPGALAASLLLAGAAPAVQVRIASWNILSGLDSSSDSATNEVSRNDDWWQVIDALNRVQPDIVGFAELNNKDFSRLPELAATLGYPYYALSSETMNSGEYRQGVMSKFEITSSSLVKENTVDPDAKEIKRWPIHATIAVPGALNPLHVFVVHTHPGTATKQNALLRAMNAWRMRQYLDRMAADLPEDVEYVVMGDFNEDAYSGEVKWDEFDYAYYTNRLAASSPFGDWFHLGSDFPWATNTAATIPYRPYPTDRFGDMAPLADTYRTGLEADLDRTTYPKTEGRVLDYILFSEEILQSAYGAPQCEVYWAANDLSDGSAGLPKPGPWLDTLHIGSDLTAAKDGLDHLMVFGDFHMIDAVAGLTPVAIISEVATVTNHTSANFIEVSNTGASPLKIDGYSLEVYCDGASTNSFSISLSGSIPANGSWWVGYSRVDYVSNYWAPIVVSNGLSWVEPDATSSKLASLDGNDAIVLRNASGAILDVYGGIGVDGTGKPWNYASRVAARVPGVTEPITVWSADEWTLSDLFAGTPGHHDSISDADVAVSGLALSPSAPAANTPFALTATISPNALASNLEVTAHFSVNGGDWSSGVAMTNVSGNLWSALANLACTPGDLLLCLVEVAFDGPGDLSPVYSAQFDYTFPGLTNGAGRLRTPRFNEVAPTAASPFVELVGPASTNLADWSVEHWRIAPADVQCLWTNVFASDFALSNPGTIDEWNNPVGFAVFSTNAFETATPAALVLFDPQGRVQDAIAWLPNATNAFVESFLPDTVLSTNAAQGAANYLHVLGKVSTASRSLQAPNWVLAGRATNALIRLTQWSSASSTSGTLNRAQTSGALRLVRVDRDGDSLLDDEDNCPDTPNATQADIDGDGIGNDCDDDMDGDGIPNYVDNCPDTSNPTQADSDGDGVGDTCDDDFAESGLATETICVTFESIAPSATSFTDGGRVWTLSNAAVTTNAASPKIGNRALLLSPGGTLTLDGQLANGISSFVLFYAASDDATNLHLEISSDGTNWTYYAHLPPATTSPLARTQAALPIATPVFFRIRLADTAAAPLAIDNLYLSATVRTRADVDLDADLVVTTDALATNSFTVTPASAVWSVVYTNFATSASSPAPSEIGIWSAVVTVETTDAILGDVFTFTNSLVVKAPVVPPVVTAVKSLADATVAYLSGTVVPNSDEPLSVIFEYGTSTKFGNKIAADESPVSGTNAVSVYATPTGLLPSTLYYWRITAGDVVSATKNFTTDDLPVPVLSPEVLADTSVWPSWTPVEGATNYVLSVYSLSAGGSGAQCAEHFANWPTGYSSSYVSGTVTSTNGAWVLTSCAIVPTGSKSDPGSKGYLSMVGTRSSALQFPPLDDIQSVAFAARNSSYWTATLVLQASTDGGTNFTDVASYSLARSCAWKTNEWSSPLPAGTILRLQCTSGYVYLHDVVVTESRASSAYVDGYPRSVAPSESDFLVEGLTPATTYYLTLLAQGPGWETAVSEPLEITTLAEGSTPAFTKWLFPPEVTVGDTFTTNILVTADPLPYNIFIQSSTAADPDSYSYAYDATNWTDILAPGIFTYTPTVADIGTNTFTFVAQNEHGAATNDFTVIVVTDPYTQWLASLDLVDRDGFDPDPTADPDEDGFTNYEEYLAGTNPTNVSSRFELVLPPAVVSSTNVVWTFQGSTNRAYQLLTSSNLHDWVTNALSPDPSTGLVSFTNSLLETLFSRLRAAPKPPTSD